MGNSEEGTLRKYLSGEYGMEAGDIDFNMTGAVERGLKLGIDEGLLGALCRGFMGVRNLMENLRTAGDAEGLEVAREEEKFELRVDTESGLLHERIRRHYESQGFKLYKEDKEDWGALFFERGDEGKSVCCHVYPSRVLITVYGDSVKSQTPQAGGQTPSFRARGSDSIN